jgi:1-phosphatidylinositol-3-phosphate 5-kinase
MTISKVSNIARQFERMSKDNERANRRYAVLKGRKARPVTVARARVEVFKNAQEAAQDPSDDSSQSSEADDEDEGEEDSAPLTSSTPSVSEAQATALNAPSVAPISPAGHEDPAIPAALPVAVESFSTEVSAHLSGTSPTSASTSSELPTVDELLPTISPDDTGNSTESSTMIGTVAAWWRSTQGAVPLHYPL